MLFLTEFLFHQMLFLRRICSSISWRCLQVHHYVWNRTDIFRILVFKLSVVCFNKYILAVFFFLSGRFGSNFLTFPGWQVEKYTFFFLQILITMKECTHFVVKTGQWVQKIVILRQNLLLGKMEHSFWTHKLVVHVQVGCRWLLQ